jgi:hypothetical protein
MLIEKLDCNYNTFYDKVDILDVNEIVLITRITNIVLEYGETFKAEYFGDCGCDINPVIYTNKNLNSLMLEVDKDIHVDASTFKISIPKKINSVKIYTDAGSVLVKNNAEINLLKISTKIGTVNIEKKCKIRNLVVDTVSGNINISSSRYATINSETGDVTAQFGTEFRESKISTISGNINIILLNKNVLLDLKSISGMIKSSVQNNKKSNVSICIDTIIGNIIID